MVTLMFDFLLGGRIGYNLCKIIWSNPKSFLQEPYYMIEMHFSRTFFSLHWQFILHSEDGDLVVRTCVMGTNKVFWYLG